MMTRPLTDSHPALPARGRGGRSPKVRWGEFTSIQRNSWETPVAFRLAGGDCSYNCRRRRLDKNHCPPEQRFLDVHRSRRGLGALLEGTQRKNYRSWGLLGVVEGSVVPVMDMGKGVTKSHLHVPPGLLTPCDRKGKTRTREGFHWGG